MLFQANEQSVEEKKTVHNTCVKGDIDPSTEQFLKIDFSAVDLLWGSSVVEQGLPEHSK